MYFDFFIALLFFLIVAVVVYGTLIVARIVRRKRHYAEKLSTYECGEPTIGSSWIRFNLRFYTTALVFLIFDVEVVFLFPVLLNLKDMGWLAFFEIFFFVGILALGLVYAWAYGALDWNREDQSKDTMAETDADQSLNSTAKIPEITSPGKASKE